MSRRASNSQKSLRRKERSTLADVDPGIDLSTVGGGCYEPTQPSAWRKDRPADLGWSHSQLERVASRGKESAVTRPPLRRQRPSVDSVQRTDSTAHPISPDAGNDDDGGPETVELHYDQALKNVQTRSPGSGLSTRHSCTDEVQSHLDSGTAPDYSTIYDTLLKAGGVLDQLQAVIDPLFVGSTSRCETLDFFSPPTLRTLKREERTARMLLRSTLDLKSVVGAVDVALSVREFQKYARFYTEGAGAEAEDIIRLQLAALTATTRNWVIAQKQVRSIPDTCSLAISDLSSSVERLTEVLRSPGKDAHQATGGERSSSKPTSPLPASTTAPDPGEDDRRDGSPSTPPWLLPATATAIGLATAYGVYSLWRAGRAGGSVE